MHPEEEQCFKDTNYAYGIRRKGVARRGTSKKNS